MPPFFPEVQRIKSDTTAIATAHNSVFRLINLD
jgi:hypothetical protein